MTMPLNPTLMDFARREDPDGKITKIVELLTQSNEILEDMTFVEGNLATGNLTTIRTGLPSATWRLLNYGVQPSKSTTRQVTDSCGMLEAFAEVDKKLADLNGNTALFRLSEDMAFLEAMNQQMAATIFYGNTATDPEKFVGFAPRFNTPDATITAGSPATSGYNILDGGGTGSKNTSIWLVYWGPNTCFGIFPKGSKAGFTQQDLGECVLYDDNTPPGKYMGYRTHYKWDIGLTVRNWRYVVRIANIDTDNLQSGTGAADLVKLMIKAMGRPLTPGLGRPAFYANQLVRTALELQMLERNNLHLSYGELQNPGVQALKFNGVPIRRVDQLLLTEDAVTGTFAAA